MIAMCKFQAGGTMPRTMGGRIKAALIEKEMNQTELRKALAQHGVVISKAQVSKLVGGSVKRPPTKTLQAIKQILGVSLDYLVDSDEPEEEERFMSDEANQIGAMVDAMLPRSRQLLLSIADGLLRIDEEQYESDARLSQLLMENISGLANGYRAEAREYIERTELARRRLKFHHR